MRRHWLAACLIYLLCAAAITWPLVTRMGTHIFGRLSSDSLERLHHVWWLAHALRTGQSLFWLPNLGWPEGMAGISLLGQPLQHLPLVPPALVLPLVVADNLALLLQMALMGLGMYALGLHLARGCRAAALVGGLVFMAAPTFQAHLGDGHNIHLSLAFAPLFVLALLRMRDAGGRSRRRWFLGAALSFALVSGGHALNIIYMLLPLTLTFALRGLRRRDWPCLAQLVPVCLAGAMLQFLFLFPVIGDTLGDPAYTAAGGEARFSLDLAAVVTPSPNHPLYGRLEYTHRVLESYIAERSAWIGLAAGGLALVALLRGRGRFWLALALLSWLLALGPFLSVLGEPLTVQVDGHASYVTLPQLLLEGLPVLNINRTPGRFSFALALAVACLATRGMALLAASPGLQGRRRRVAATSLLLALILLDYQWYWPLPAGAAHIPAEIAGLANRSDVRAVLDIPVQHTLFDKEALWLQTGHQKPILGGYVIRGSPVNPARLRLLQETLDPALLQAAGADIVIVHLRYVSQRLYELAGARLGPPIYLDKYYAVYETPAADAASSPAFIPPATTQRIQDELQAPLYSPRTGWLEVSADMTAGGRDLRVLLDAREALRWRAPAEGDEARTRRASLALQADGWHMLTIMPAPQCSTVADPVLLCPQEEIENFRLEVTPATHLQADFEEGVTLRAGTPPQRARAGEELVVRLFWELARGRSQFDVRFVHLLDASGQLVAQSDEAPGPLPAGGQLADRATLPLPEDLPAGEYSLWLGWYRHPELRRLMLIGPEGPQGSVFPLGVVRVE